MPWALRAAVFLTGVCALYVTGYIAMAATEPPWGLLWMPPLAFVGGGAWYLLERLDGRLHRRNRERAEHGAGPEHVP